MQRPNRFGHLLKSSVVSSIPVLASGYDQGFLDKLRTFFVEKMAEELSSKENLISGTSVYELAGVFGAYFPGNSASISRNNMKQLRKRLLKM